MRQGATMQHFQVECTGPPDLDRLPGASSAVEAAPGSCGLPPPPPSHPAPAAAAFAAAAASRGRRPPPQRPASTAAARCRWRGHGCPCVCLAALLVQRGIQFGRWRQQGGRGGTQLCHGGVHSVTPFGAGPFFPTSCLEHFFCCASRLCGALHPSSSPKAASVVVTISALCRPLWPPAPTPRRRLTPAHVAGPSRRRLARP